MFKKIEKIAKNFSRNIGLFALFSTVVSITLLASASSLNATPTFPVLPSPNSGTPPPPQQQQPPPPQQQQPQQQPPQQQQVISPPPQFPQISWDELEEAGGFIANGKMNSTLFTINGNWKATGDWSMNVADGELTSFNTTMTWNNGTSGHTHEFSNFEADDEGVDISAEDQTISVAGTMDVGTNGAVVWEDVPSEITIERGKIITASVDNEATEQHFSGQSVYGNLTSLSICSTGAPGPGMQVSPGC